MNEHVKFDVIKSLVDHGCKNKLRASLKLGCTIRTINRMIVGYKKQGKSFFIHGNTGRAPVNKTPETLKTKIIKLYKTKYFEDVYVVTGHTPTLTIKENPRPGYIYRINNHIAIDCGACFPGGRLAAICLDTGEEFYSDD